MNNAQLLGRLIANVLLSAAGVALLWSAFGFTAALGFYLLALFIRPDE